MKQVLFLFVFLCSTFSIQIRGQQSIKISDINLVNLGDGQAYAHNKDEAKTPVKGKVRIITGVTTEYINAQFNDEGLAIGKWEYYKNNELRSYISYQNGYMNGEWGEISSSGDLKEKREYKNGKKDGKWIKYYDPETPKEIKVYQDNKLCQTKTYYTNGNLESERNFSNGKEHGSYKRYTLEGNLKMDENYENGKKVGKQIVYYTSNLSDYIETSNYSSLGKLDGEFSQVYTETKATKVKGQYTKGQKAGVWKYYSLSGKPIKEELYENGVLKETRKFEN